MKRLITLVCLLTLLIVGSADATVRNATPATFASVYAASQGGDRVRLATGTYHITGKDTPGTGRIVIGPQPGASPTVSFRFDGQASDLTFNNLHITDGLINSADAERFTLQNSDVTGQIVVRQDAGVEASAIVFRNDNFHDWVWPDGTYEGQLSICGCGNSNFLNGITIRDSVFHGMTADGIQDSGTGTRIIHNEFYDLHSDDASGVHADPIQTWGGSKHLIKGNYFHNLPETSTLMMPDGIDHETITDNVVAVTATYPYSFTVFDDDHSTIRYNTLAYKTGCGFGNACGGIRMGTKFPGTTGDEFTRVDHNIMGWANNEDGTNSIRNANLVGEGPLFGTEVRGTPQFVGGAVPNSYCGYKLTAASPGQGWGARTDLYC